MRANEFMSKIDKGEIKFNSVFASGTFGWEFDFAEAYAESQVKLYKPLADEYMEGKKDLEIELKEVKAENKKLKSQAVMVDTSDPFEYVLHQNNNKDTYSYNPQFGNGEMLNDFLLNADRLKDITK